MSRKGNCIDNCIMESFFGTLKNEMFYGHESEFKTFEDLHEAIEKYINYYNNERIKSKTKWMPPSKFREASVLSLCYNPVNLSSLLSTHQKGCSMLFRLSDKKVTIVKESHFGLEKEIQKLVEDNLADIFPDLRLTFLKSELTIGEFRFDSLAFDERNKVFYILEYKNVEKKSLVDQGVAYLKTLLDRKTEFTYLLEELKGIELKPKAIDWGATRVIFIAPSYNNYQLEIAKLRNAPFSLYKFSKYDKDFFSLEKIEYKAKDKTDFNDLNLGLESREVKKEIKVYSEEDHLKDKPTKIKELYEKLKDSILSLDADIQIEPKKLYIAFKGTKTNICDLELFKSNIKVLINLNVGQIEDPFKIAKVMKYNDGSRIGHHGNGDYQVIVEDENIVDKLMFLIKQSYKVNG